MLVLFPSKKHKRRTHQNILFRWNNENEVLVMFYQYFTSTEALITFKMFR